nr:hypothetical protein [Lachnospiraceae bacterium]
MSNSNSKINSKITIMTRSFLSRFIAISLCLTVILSMSACGKKNSTNKTHSKPTKEAKYKYKEYANLSAEKIVEKLTLEQKASQMVMADCKKTNSDEVKREDYGAILSIPNSIYTRDDWVKSVDEFQKAAIESEAGIPIIYGN